MTTYTSIFGGNAVKPADMSLTVISLTSNQTLSWPSDGGTPAVSAIIEVTPNAGGRVLTLPDARRAGNGETITVKNYGSFSFTVKDNTGGSVVSVAAGLIYTIYLRDNSTQAGSWSYWQAGAGTSVADASALQGAGLDALSGLLRVKATAASYAASQAFSDGNRGGIAVWTGGSGTFSMPRANSVGNGWYMIFKNAGSGTLQIASTNSETFDGASDITLAAGEGATVFSNGTNFSFVRHTNTSSGSAAYSYTSISVAGSGTYNLSAAEYSKQALNFTGVLTGNRSIVVPTAVARYDVTNNTSGAYTLTVKTAAGTGIAITQGKAQSVYCDGTNVVSANTDYPAGITTPVSIANGGTGSTTAGAALTALGGTATGTAVFTAANAAAGRSAISAAATGANTDISGVTLGNTGLTVRDTDASHFLTIKPGSNLTADRVFTLTTGDAARTLDISAGDVTVSTAGAALLDDADAAAQRTTLGLGTMATQAANNVAITGGTITGLSSAIPAASGGTGVTTSTGTGSNVLSASPALTGTPTAPTAAAATNTTQIATTAFVTAAVNASGFVQVGTVSSTSGTTATISGLTLTDYKTLRVVFNQVSHSSGTSQYLRSTGQNKQLCNAVNSSTLVYGYMEIDLLSGCGFAISLNNDYSNLGYFNISTSSTSISFDWSGGAAFDNGTITAYASR